MRRALDDRDLDPLRSRLAGGEYDQIILVLAHEAWGDPEHRTRGLLSEGWRRVGKVEIRDVAIEWYQKTGQN
jgi:hypothetical protein